MLNDVLEKFHDECVQVNKLERKIKDSRDRKKKEKKIQEKKKHVRSVHELMDQVINAFFEQIKAQGLSEASNKDFVEVANALGRYLAYTVRMNAIRQFLTALRKIETIRPYDPDLTALLRPKLAYAVGRSGPDEKRFLVRFMNLFDPILQAVSASDERKHFEKSLKFMESVIAYHRFYGGAE